MTGPNPNTNSATRIQGRRNELWMQRSRCVTEYGPRFELEEPIVQIRCCRKCPVTAECLDYALRTEHPLTTGAHSIKPIYGGLTYDQRSQLARTARR